VPRSARLEKKPPSRGFFVVGLMSRYSGDTARFGQTLIKCLDLR
jgi:hypothetical protein